MGLTIALSPVWGHVPEGRDGDTLLKEGMGPPQGPGQAGELGLCEPHGVQPGQTQRAAPGPGQCPNTADGQQSWEEGLDMARTQDTALPGLVPGWAAGMGDSAPVLR